jgi:subtilisin-like proprotein convertase family protein
MALGLTVLLALMVSFAQSVPFVSADRPQRPANDSAITTTQMVEAEIAATAEALDVLDSLGLNTRPSLTAGHIVVDLDRDQQELLTTRDIDYTVLRRFIDATGSGEDLKGLNYAYVSGSNGTDVAIQDYAWSQTSINIAGIPANNYIAGADIRVKIVHPRISDLYMFVNDPGPSYSQRIWDREGGSASNLDQWFTSRRHWNGAQGNGTWTLFVWDGATGNTGYIDFWEIRVYYGTLNTPTPTPACNMSLPSPYDVRVNAGGADYVDSGGYLWSADRTLQYCTAPYWGATGGDTYKNPQPIDGTADDPLYQSQRYFASTDGYTFWVPGPGQYEVTLKFAEIYLSTQVGGRVFDVQIEGQSAAQAIDVLHRAGNAKKAYDMKLLVPISDNDVRITFNRDPDKGAPFVSAIRVRKISENTPTPTPSPTNVPTSTATATATPAPTMVALTLDSAIGSYDAGQVFPVDIVIQTGGQSVDSAQVFLSFDPAYLSVVDEAGNPATAIISSQAYAVHLVNAVDNTVGQIYYADGLLTGAPPGGTFVLATVRFKAKAAIDGTTVAFNLVAPRQSKLTAGGNNILGATTGGRYTISMSSSIADFVGVIRLQGRPDAPHNLLAVPVTVNFFAPGGSAPFLTRTATTDVNGAFTVTGVPIGSWDVTVKNAQALSSKKLNVVVSASGTVPVNFGVLKEGDANDDDIVDISDFSILRAAFLKSCAETGFDARADFNGDCTVDISGSSLLRTNFLISGPVIVP